MPIVDVVVQDFRNIALAELRFAPQLNLITGTNGAGKTSLLEALYFLGRAQSFRTSHSEALIREGSSGLLLRAHIETACGGIRHLGMQRDRVRMQIRMDGRTVARVSELLPHFPFQLFTPESHKLLEGGPSYRRKYMDWGVFHVEPEFFPVWQRFTRALKQRNASLRANASVREVCLWDNELVAAADALDAMRRSYVADLLPRLQRTIADLSGLTHLGWDYRPGWNRKLEYAQALKDGLDGDRRQGFTRSGPHRADLMPAVEGAPANERVSRGQQKQIAIAMMLAQAELYSRRTGLQCIFLVDDLASELDDRHRMQVQEYFRDLRAQVFLTAIDPATVDTSLWQQPAVFHVEHGQVHQ